MSLVGAEAVFDTSITCLRSHHTPCGLRVHERRIEPILLATAHHRASCVVRNLVDVVCVPVQVGDRSVILARVQHDQINERPN